MPQMSDCINGGAGILWQAKQSFVPGFEHKIF